MSLLYDRWSDHNDSMNTIIMYKPTELKRSVSSQYQSFTKLLNKQLLTDHISWNTNRFRVALLSRWYHDPVECKYFLIPPSSAFEAYDDANLFNYERNWAAVRDGNSNMSSIRTIIHCQNLYRRKEMNFDVISAELIKYSPVSHNDTFDGLHCNEITTNSILQFVLS